MVTNTTNQNGKGSRPRPTKLAQYRANYDAIDWRKPNNPTHTIPAKIHSQEILPKMMKNAPLELQAQRKKGNE